MKENYTIKREKKSITNKQKQKIIIIINVSNNLNLNQDNSFSHPLNIAATHIEPNQN